MVIVKLTGGLGNQLFQYALGRQIAERRRTELFLDTSKFDSGDIRSYRLGFFNICGALISSARVKNFQAAREGIFWRRLERYRPYYKRRVLKEQSLCFDPKVLTALRNVCLVGYWQSERYFDAIKDIIRKDFTLKFPLSSQSKDVLAQIARSDSICVHIRRGDYVHDAATSQDHGVCDLLYYDSAVKMLLSEVKTPTFFVFSDDLPWAKTNLHLPGPAIYVEGNGAERDYEDMHLMSQCRHFVIANSSFSWWGAWLSTNRKKIVIAPRQWFRSSKNHAHDIVPEGWKRL